MRTPELAVDELTARVRRHAAGARDPETIRVAFAAVLADLGVQPGDAAWTDGRDVIGAAYERLIAGRDRRALGQFFTPLSVGRAMAAWLLATEPRMLVDPACGSGSLIAAAAHERQGSTKLLGIDVDPFAVAMTTANGALRRVAGLDVHCGNFLLDEIDEHPDAVLCNPPFTRHQELSREGKVAIHEGFKKRLGLEFSQLASLHVLFLVRALEVSSADARLAFITPAHWLDMSYGRAVKEFVLEHANVEAIVQLTAPQPVFEHALTTAAITLLRKRRVGETASRTRFAAVTAMGRDDILCALNGETDAALVELTSTEKWSRVSSRRRRRVTRLDEVAHVRRGVATGCNEFFVLSDEERRAHKLNRCYLRPCAASPRWFAGDEINENVLDTLPNGAPRWLLYPSRARLGGPLEYYLQRAGQLGVHERHLVELRVKAGRPWWQVEADFEAPILFTYFNRDRPRFVRNRVGAVPLNNWLAIQPRAGVDVEALFGALQLAGASVLRRNAREYGNGLWKLEPSELRSLALPEI